MKPVLPGSSAYRNHLDWENRILVLYWSHNIGRCCLSNVQVLYLCSVTVKTSPWLCLLWQYCRFWCVINGNCTFECSHVKLFLGVPHEVLQLWRGKKKEKKVSVICASPNFRWCSNEMLTTPVLALNCLKKYWFHIRIPYLKESKLISSDGF